MGPTPKTSTHRPSPRTSKSKRTGSGEATRMSESRLNSRVEDLLIALTAILRHRAERAIARGGSPRGWRRNREFDAALEALVAIGLLDSTAARAWRRRLATAVDAAGSPRRAVIDPRMRRKFADLLNAVAHDQREEFLTVVTAALELGVISDAK